MKIIFQVSEVSVIDTSNQPCGANQNGPLFRFFNSLHSEDVAMVFFYCKQYPYHEHSLQ